MMIKTNKFISILFSMLLVLIVCLTVSCNKESDTDSNKSTQSSTSTSSPEESNDDCEHANLLWVVDKAPSCTEEGSRHKECADCKKVVETEAIGKAPHTDEIIPGKSATCTESGLTDGKKCSVCSATLIEQTTIAAKGHSIVTVESKKATCEEKGMSDSAYCSVCNTVLKEATEVPSLEHRLGDWIIDKAAEIGVEGARHKECSLCNKIIETEVIEAIAESHSHSGAYWSVTKPATCTTEGINSYLCSCGYAVETKPIAITGHTEEEIPGRAPTCMVSGLTTGKKCSVCDKVLFAQSTVAKVDHTPETILGKTPTCTLSGTTDGTKCSYCGTILAAQLALPPTGHSFSNAICTTCGTEEPFGVWIVDGLGNPVNDVIIKVMKDGEQVKMYPYKGEFVEFDMAIDTYTIELDLSQLDSEYVFDESQCVITPNKRSASIRLFKTVSEKETLFIGNPISKDYDAYFIDQGSYRVELKPNDYTFFIFAPKKAATYTFTYECDSELSIGYHGGSFFAQGNDLSVVSEGFGKYENGIFANIYSSNVGGSYVFSIKSTSATSCIFNIGNAGDPGVRLEDTPWSAYLESSGTVNAQLNANPTGSYTAIDLTDLFIKAVFNKTDGYYHLNSENGPVIYIDLTSDSRYVSSIQTICANQRMGTYIYDLNGKVVEKRSYNELFHQYGMPTDTSAVDKPIRIPLTEKLAEAVKAFGNKNSWWDENSESNIFKKVLMSTPYNQEYAWLLYCGIYQ